MSHVNNTYAKLAPDSILNKKIKEIITLYGGGGHRTSPVDRVFYRSNRLSLQLNRPLRNTKITFAFCFGKACSPYSCNDRKHRCKHVSDSVPSSFDIHEHFDYNIASLAGIIIVQFLLAAMIAVTTKEMSPALSQVVLQI